MIDKVQQKPEFKARPRAGQLQIGGMCFESRLIEVLMFVMVEDTIDRVLWISPSFFVVPQAFCLIDQRARIQAACIDLNIGGTQPVLIF